MPIPRRRRAASLALALALLPVLAHAQAAPDSGSAPAASLERVSEQVRTLQRRMDQLARVKFSGYVQARYEIGETSSDTVKVSGSPATVAPANRDRFFLRRARLKLTFDPATRTQAVVYLHGASTGNTLDVSLLEAHVTLLDPWTADHRHRLTIGQMNVPFGFELERSSSVRELPERSRAENVLFAGERDRGLKLVSRWTPRFETVVGAFNGGGPLHATYGTEDPTRGKDVVGRARVSAGALDVGVSGYAGDATLALTGPDVTLDRTRFGADAQVRWKLASAGAGALYGEWYSGTNPNADSIKAYVQSPTAANPVTILAAGADAARLDTPFHGWYAMVAQDLGARAQVALRYEEFDPDDDAAGDRYRRFGAALNLFVDAATRFTIAYDAPDTGAADPADNLWTFQMQLKY